MCYHTSLLTFLLVSLERVYAAEFFCPSGDVTCLVAAINQANQNGQDNTINLEAGEYTLTSVDNRDEFSGSANGLPIIAGRMTIQGPEGIGATIERDPAAPEFRLFQVAEGGTLKLSWLGIRNGTLLRSLGAGIVNVGALTIHNSALYNNRTVLGTGGAIYSIGTLNIKDTEIRNNLAFFGGGIRTDGITLIEDSFIFGNSGERGGGIEIGGIEIISGETIIRRTTISNNQSFRPGGAGVSNSGPLTIENSTIDANVNRMGSGGGLFNDGALNLVSSTVSRNRNDVGVGAGIWNTGTASILNSTITQNQPGSLGGGGGLASEGGTVDLQNTIIAGNTRGMGLSEQPSDCDFARSQGNNIIGDLTGCNINLQPTDRTGDPRLGEYTEDLFVAGSGHFPLLADSPAVDAGNPETCPATDQLGLPRIANCDIGAVEFQNGRLPVSIDIRPRSDANRINPASTNNINVAIFSRNDFDANTIDFTSVRFGATGTEAAPINVVRRDVDRDGRGDLVLRFQIENMRIDCGDISAMLTGQISGAGSIIGSGPITTIQCNTLLSVNSRPS
jgi:hypothetical protein